MMRATIFSFTFHGENSMVASTRIANFISQKMSLPVHDHRSIEQVLGKPLDLLIIINGAYGFCKCLPQLAELVVNASRIVWVQNDYSIIPPKIDSKGVSPFRAAFRERHEKGLPHMDFWTTCEDWARFTPDSLYVNWNALTFDEKYDERVIARRRSSKSNNNLLYYGSFRDGSGKSSRVRYFDRYFAEPKVHTIISSPAKQFRERYTHDKIQHEDAIKNDFYGVLGGCGLGLYLEDRMSHERFHSPANRFYEMLSAGLPMVFQPEAESMMARAGFKIEKYVVHTAISVIARMNNREEIGEEQRRDWVGQDPAKLRRVLTEQFNSALQAQMDRMAS
jgi:hypothetical protein